MTARMFGGPVDGRVYALDADLLHGLRVPEAYGLWPVEPTIHLYVWDGTINEAGERRMRWTGEPRRI